jgi:hypothetical protein
VRSRGRQPPARPGSGSRSAYGRVGGAPGARRAPAARRRLGARPHRRAGAGLAPLFGRVIPPPPDLPVRPAARARGRGGGRRGRRSAAPDRRAGSSHGGRGCCALRPAPERGGAGATGGRPNEAGDGRRGSCLSGSCCGVPLEGRRPAPGPARRSPRHNRLLRQGSTADRLRDRVRLRPAPARRRSDHATWRRGVPDAADRRPAGDHVAPVGTHLRADRICVPAGAGRTRELALS